MEIGSTQRLLMSNVEMSNVINEFLYMIRLKKNIVVRGIASYDVYFGEELQPFSVIVREQFAPNDGRYKLKVYEDCVMILYPQNGKRCGEIRSGNGLFDKIGCTMHCGELVAGVLCVKGNDWLEIIKAEIRVGDKCMVVDG